MTTSRTSLALAIFMLMATVSVGFAQPTYKVNPEATRVGFSIKNLGSKVPGEFKVFSGNLVFSKNKPEASSVSFAVDVASIDTDIEKRDKHLRSDDYFAASTYPQMTFKSESFKNVGGDRYRVTGPLTIKGHTKNVSIFATMERKTQLWNVNGESLVFTSSFEIDRTEFGVGESSSILSNQVAVDLKLDFRTK